MHWLAFDSIPLLQGCGDIEFAASAIVLGEPIRDYGRSASNQSSWSMLPSDALGTGIEVAMPQLTALSAVHWFEQTETFEWRMPPIVPSARFEAVGALAIAIDLGIVPSLGGMLENVRTSAPLLRSCSMPICSDFIAHALFALSCIRTRMKRTIVPDGYPGQR
eukprot:SAG11_NODE_3320_length_2525_cov_2.455070_3_plen_163_part_00